MNAEFWWYDNDREIPTNAEEHLFQCHFARHKSYTVAPGVEPKLTTCEGRNLLGFLNFSENQSRPTPSTVYLRIHLLIDMHPSVNRHSYWIIKRLMKGPMCCPETPVTNYQATPLNIPEEQRPLPSLLSLGSTGTALMFRPAGLELIFSYVPKNRYINKCVLGQLSALL
jgi:hypothetical protein